MKIIFSSPLYPFSFIDSSFCSIFNVFFLWEYHGQMVQWKWKYVWNSCQDPLVSSNLNYTRRHLFTTSHWRYDVRLVNLSRNHCKVTPHPQHVFWVFFSKTFDWHKKCNYPSNLDSISLVSKLKPIPRYCGAFCENSMSRSFSREKKYLPKVL